MGSTPQDERFGALLEALREWREAASEVENLALKIDEITQNPNDWSLDDLLKEKRLAYKKALALSEHYTELDGQISTMTGGVSSDLLAEHGRLRTELLNTLTHTSQLEADAEKRVQERMNLIKTKLDAKRKTRNISHAYGKPGSLNSRFLDQSR